MDADLLRAVLENPLDDAVRLVAADQYDADGKHERAALIRHQIAMAGLSHNHKAKGFGGSPDGCPVCRLRRMEKRLPISDAIRELIREFSLCWVPKDGFKVPSGSREALELGQRNGRAVRQLQDSVVERGFVSAVYCDMVTYAQYAKNIFAAQPVTLLRLTDAGDPLPDVRRHRLVGAYGWHAQNFDPELWRWLHHPEPVIRGVMWIMYRSRAAALDALDRATVNYGRSQVGLSPLPTTIPPRPDSHVAQPRRV